MQAAQKVTDQARQSKYRQYAQPILLSSIIVSPANYNMLRAHMGQISQHQYKNAAAGENRDIGPFRRCPKLLTSMLSF